MKDKQKKNKGITLIALIVTIIVLLILAGVTINTLFGEHGIIERTKWARFVSNYRGKEEQVELYKGEQQLDKYIKESKVTSRSGEREANENSEEDQRLKNYPVENKVGVEELGKNTTLIETIKEVKQKEEIDINTLEIYWISDTKLKQKEEKEKYVIDIEDGKLYKWKGERIYKKIWHIPEIYVNSEGEAEDNEEEQGEKLVIIPGKVSIEYGQTQEVKAKLGEEEIEIKEILWEATEPEEKVEDIIGDIGEYEEGEEPEEVIEEEKDYEDDIVSIKDGVITGEAIGETRVEAIYYKDGKKYSTYVNMEVIGEEGEITKDTVIELVPITVNRGKIKTVKAYVNGKRIANRKFTWTTENENIAKIGKTGRVTGVKGTINNGKVKVIGTYKKDESIKVECEVTVQELTSFVPELSISGRNLIIKNNIDKKYGMIYYTYKIDGQQVKKSKSKRYTAKNKVIANTTYKVEVIVSNGKYTVSSGEVEITSPTYCAGMEICNISPYGYDIYVYEVSDLVGKINFVVTTSSGTSKTIVAEKVEEGKYYARVNVSDFNNQSGTYTVKAVLYNTSNVNVEEITQNCDVPTVNTEVTNITAESLVVGVRDNNIPDGYCDMTVNGKTYNLEVLNIKDSKIYNEETNTYSIRGLTVGTYNQSRTAVIKCDGNLAINGTVTTGIGTIDGYANLTKVKGLFICSTGDLTNNGTISMTARGTYNTEGEDIYLWKNAVYEDESKKYEYVPADGAVGGEGVTIKNTAQNINKGISREGIHGDNGTNRGTGGGASGSASGARATSYKWTITSGAGSAGTSYSGGSGGGSINVHYNGTYTASNAESNGGAGGYAYAARTETSWMARYAGGGAGNPGGIGKNTTSGKKVGVDSTGYSGETGTGGLLIVYSNNMYNKGNIYSNGSSGGLGLSIGGASGGGSINVFYNKNYNTDGKIEANGGYYGNNAQGGNGSVTIGNISTGTFKIYNE